MEDYKFSTPEYKRHDLETRRVSLAAWKDAAEHAESYAALGALLFRIGRETCELSTQYSIAYVRHALDECEEFYEAEIRYLRDTIASSPFGPDVEQKFGNLFLKNILVGHQQKRQAF